MSKTTTTKMILVTYDAAEGCLAARCEEDHTLNSNTVRWDAPIDAGTDSHAIANAVTEINGAEIVSVEHDGDTVHVEVSGEVCD